MHILKTFSYKKHTTKCIIIESMGKFGGFHRVREMGGTIMITKAIFFKFIWTSFPIIEWNIISGFPCNFTVQLTYDAGHFRNSSAMSEGPVLADFTYSDRYRSE
jgi:hypothetical protein